MKLQFLGASRQVTGSRYLLQTRKTCVFIDCGLFQERAFQGRNWEPSPIPPGEVDALLLTHAHLDHCGLIPKFVREGFRGSIFATPPSIDLARIIWADSARIQVEDAAYKKRRHEREGRKGAHPEVPLYTPADVEVAEPLLRPVSYDTPIRVGDDIEVIYRDAGHILGSAMLEVHVDDAGTRKTIVFSGDIGQVDRPLMHDPYRFQSADYVIMESTYGDRNHEEMSDLSGTLAKIVNETIERRGNLIIPTFAIDRAQGLLYLFSELVDSGKIPRTTIFMDSPMAISATTIYKRYPHLLDDEARAMLKSRRHPFQFPGLHFVRTANESRAINSIRGSCVILAGSGMCTGGRVKHHLRQNIERPESTVLFVGFQAHGTLGRQILRGDPEVRIHGRQYAVRAQIEELNGLSAHADRDGLMHWLGGFSAAPSTLFLTHGEAEVADLLAEHVRAERGWNVVVPAYESAYDLAGGKAREV
jgi:metallo-beta-lactamase family protein